MNSFFISFKALCFHICLYLVQPRLHSFGFGFLPYERVWHPCLDGHLSKTRTWGTMDGSQTLHNVVHKLACLLILCHCFSSLDHKCAKGVHKNQNSLDNFCTFGASSFRFSRDSSRTGHSRTYLSPFPLIGPFRRRIKECTSPFNLEDK
jgi:hypothetical protein